MYIHIVCTTQCTLKCYSYTENDQLSPLYTFIHPVVFHPLLHYWLQYNHVFNHMTVN